MIIHVYPTVLKSMAETSEYSEAKTIWKPGSCVQVRREDIEVRGWIPTTGR